MLIVYNVATVLLYGYPSLLFDEDELRLYELRKAQSVELHSQKVRHSIFSPDHQPLSQKGMSCVAASRYNCTSYELVVFNALNMFFVYYDACGLFGHLFI